MGASKELQERRIKNGLCPLCQKPWIGPPGRCDDCRRKNATFHKKYRHQKKVRGICSDCGKKIFLGKVRCAKCVAIISRATAMLALRRRESGVCMWCADTNVLCDKYKLCKRCWFRRASLRVAGNFSLGEKLERLYTDQDGRCFYTGAKLKLGVNTSLDHQRPRTRNGSHNVRNFRWVSVIINRMKQNLTHKEFVETCRLISYKFRGKNGK